jgi:hypothetical protein
MFDKDLKLAPHFISLKPSDSADTPAGSKADTTKNPKSVASVLFRIADILHRSSAQAGKQTIK